MLSRHLTRLSAISVVFMLVSTLSLSAQESSHRGRKFKPPPPTAKIQVTVVRDDDSKPIENAAVIFHVDMDGDKGNMELKTNEDGKSLIDILPIGSIMRLQIIAKGFQTYGQDYKINKSDMAFEVRMKRPTRQYSIYEKHDNDNSQKDDSNSDSNKKKDSPKDKPSDSPDQGSKPQ